MAIIIPSKNILDIDNSKVRDNLINRVEVNSVEIVSYREYEKVVLIKEVSTNKYVTYETSEEEGSAYYPLYPGNLVYASGSIIYDKYVTVDIEIDKKADNAYVSKIFTGLNNNGNAYLNASKAYEETSYFYKVPNSFVYTKKAVTEQGNFITEDIREYEGEKNLIKEETIYSIKPILSTLECQYSETATGFIDGFSTPVYSKTEAKDYYLYSATNILNAPGASGYYETKTFTPAPETVETDIGGDLEITETEDAYTIKGLKFFVGRTTYSCGTAIRAPEDAETPSYYPSQVLEVNQMVVKLEFVVYGNTVGINLQDKTVYINGDTDKKVYSVERNELMQTSNYYLKDGANENSIQLLYGNTNSLYKNGKETATITCPFSDYYDFGNSSNKVISVDSADKMCFEIGDKVFPMVYGVGGGDTPMSTYSDGRAKCFEVLGVEYTYDGEPLQTLYLQEGIDDAPISKPTISIDGDTLKISLSDYRVDFFEIYVDDVLRSTVGYDMGETTYDLSALGLSSLHIVTVKAKSSDYGDSELSNRVYYAKGPRQLKDPTISFNEGEYLKITSNDERASHYVIYIRNSTVGITTSMVNNEGLHTIISLKTLELATGENKITVTAISPYYVDSPKSNEVVYYVQPEPEVPTPDGVDNEFNNELRTELLISGVWCFVDTPDIEWLNRVLRYGTNVTQFTVLASYTGDVEDINAWERTTLAFADGAIIIGDEVYTTFGDGARRFIWFDPEQTISYNLANWIVGNTFGGDNATSLMSTRARTTFPKGSIKHI